MRPKSDEKKLPWVKLTLGFVVLVAAGLLVNRGVDVRGLLERGMNTIREAGPVAFFLSMAVLPAVGMPVLAFALTAGPVFGERLGMPAVVFLSCLAITANLTLAYAMARWALRPVLKKLITRMGYKLPQVGEGGTTELIVILRCTPGIPYFVQNYLLGVAEVPFRKYFIISFVLSMPQTAAFVLFGEALLHGKGKMILIAVSILVAAGAATQLLRKRFAAKKPASIGAEQN